MFLLQRPAIPGIAADSRDRRSYLLQPERGGIGFHASPSTETGKVPQERLYQETQPDDLRHFGLIPEFIGRFPVITALDDLDQAALVRILTEPKNALVRQYQQLFAFEGVTLEFDPDALTAIAQRAIERGTGARGLRSVMEALLQRTMFELPSMSNVSSCRVTEAAVMHGAEIETTTSRNQIDVDWELSAG